ncbi:MAG: hypothetical protein R3275_07550 [Saprospiraceae bacterium]|nr:hypothetical protein [Saprospiraceae bacterium]
MRNFKNFEIWKDAMGLVCVAYDVTEQLPSGERYGLASHHRSKDPLSLSHLILLKVHVAAKKSYAIFSK